MYKSDGSKCERTLRPGKAKEKPANPEPVKAAKDPEPPKVETKAPAKK